MAHAGKTGFLYVFNRVTGEPLWPIEERAVPKTDVPGEYSSPTQPFPTKPAPFDYMRLAHPPVTFRQEKLKVEQRIPAARA